MKEVDAINKALKGTKIMRLDDSPQRGEGIPSGSIALDLALGPHGWPVGSLIELYGGEGSGKTTLATKACANVHKAGGMACMIDAEHAYDPSWAKKQGVDFDKMYFVQPETGEEALQICQAVAETGKFRLIVVDSVAALIPKAELEGEIGDAHVGGQARLMGQAMRKMKRIASQTRTTLLFLNQIRSKVGVVFGSPYTTPGGHALKFAADIRADVARSAQIKSGEEPIGQRVRIKIVKNKYAPPFKTVEVDLLYHCGISEESELIDLAIKHKVLERKGAWISFEGEHLGQGKEKCRVALAENEELARTIKEKILATEQFSH